MRAPRALAFAALLLATAAAAHAATVEVVNLDAPDEGFNDGSAATPVGGNPGTTLGAQRLVAFGYAAQRWASHLDTAVVIRIGARFDPLPCDATGAVLASAGPETAHRNFAGAPFPNTWYPQALANKLAGLDLSASARDVRATFNAALGTTCAFPRRWYYGLDDNGGTDIDLVTVALHELAHGLGFTSFVNVQTGEKLLEGDDVYMRHLEDHDSGRLFPDMTNNARARAITDTGDLHWIGPNVVAAAGALTGGRDPSGHVQMYAPDPVRPGSSLSHFSNALAPNELMEPAYTQPLGPGLAAALFEDLGWGPVVSTCGNGILDGGEACDDANAQAGDGCDGLCRVESCHACSGQPSACGPTADGTPCDDADPCTTGDACAAAACAGTPTPGAGTVFLVDTTADAPDAAIGDGACATAASACSLRAAVEEANASCGPNGVDLPAGTYGLTAGPLTIAASLQMTGAGAAVTAVDGGGLGRVLEVEGGTVGVAALTVRNGHSPPGADGGGIFNQTRLTLTDAVVSGNVADRYGGGIKHAGGELTLVRTSVVDNEAAGSGGGLDTEAPMTLIDSTIGDNVSGGTGGGIWTGAATLITGGAITGNAAAYTGGGIENQNLTVLLQVSGTLIDGNTAGYDGGGLYSAYGGALLTDCTISHNHSGHSGGGVATSAAVLEIADSRILANDASTGGGGVVVNTSGGPFGAAAISATIRGTLVEGNTAGGSGGGIAHEVYGSPGTLVVSDSTIRGNHTGADGGGVSLIGAGANLATATVTGSTFDGNTADGDGGGIRSASCDLTLANTTLSGNAATGQGGGLSNYRFYPGYETHVNNLTVAANTAASGGGVANAHELFVANSILAGNTANGSPNDCAGTIGGLGHLLIQNPGCSVTGSAAGNVTGVDPLLGPLQDNGGPTATRALLPGSPALEGGPPIGSHDTPCEATDQRGEGRPHPAGARCDMGAFERVSCQGGTLDPGEQCDDGNAVDGDGCSATCQRELLAGHKLALAANPGVPDASSLKLVAKDANLAGGRGNATVDDPVLHGGTLRVLSAAGGFDDTYDLPAEGWDYLGRAGDLRGYRYRDSHLASGPISTAQLRLGPSKRLKVIGKGSGLGHALGADPSPVDVVLTLGTRTYCWRFGGTVRFTPDRGVRAKLAAPPSTCPP